MAKKVMGLIKLQIQLEKRLRLHRSDLLLDSMELI